MVDVITGKNGKEAPMKNEKMISLAGEPNESSPHGTCGTESKGARLYQSENTASYLKFYENWKNKNELEEHIVMPYLETSKQLKK